MKENLTKLRERVWYQRFYREGMTLKSMGFTQAQIEITLNLLWTYLNNSHGFRSGIVARSAEESMQVACNDVKRQQIEKLMNQYQINEEEANLIYSTRITLIYANPKFVHDIKEDMIQAGKEAAKIYKMNTGGE